jgi:hypothetical protein
MRSRPPWLNLSIGSRGSAPYHPYGLLLPHLRTLRASGVRVRTRSGSCPLLGRGVARTARCIRSRRRRVPLPGHEGVLRSGTFQHATARTARLATLLEPDAGHECSIEGRGSGRAPRRPQPGADARLPLGAAPRTRAYRVAPVATSRRCGPCRAAWCSHSVTTGRPSVFASANESPAFTGLSDGGRYWARTSDPQLVELVLSQLS